MAGHNLKSLSITNLDASPIVANTVGEGAPGVMREVSDFVTTVSSDDTTSTYRLCRFPTTAKVKTVKIFSKIASAGSGDIDVAFSDSTTDGTPSSLTGVVQVTGPADNKLFGAAQSLVLAGVNTDFTFKGTYLPAMQNIPMWNNLVGLGATQFTADPGGFFDLYVVITTTITTGGVLSGTVSFVE
jgi:hypothetical protein